MSKRAYDLTVQSIHSISPHVQRVVLHGSELDAFPDAFEGGYVKLMLPAAAAGEQRIARRSYTVRTFDRAAQTLTLEFAEHDAAGPATTWLRNAQVGQSITVAGPGPVKRLDPARDWFLLAGDLTSLPAIAVNLERLPKSAVGRCVVQVPHEDDIRPLDAPEGIAVEWLVQSPSERSRLSDAVRDVVWQAGAPSVWVACEFSDMREIRSYLMQERGLTNDDLYISSYWKAGATDEEHKVAKQRAAQTSG